MPIRSIIDENGNTQYLIDGSSSLQALKDMIRIMTVLQYDYNTKIRSHNWSSYRIKTWIPLIIQFLMILCGNNLAPLIEYIINPPKQLKNTQQNLLRQLPSYNKLFNNTL